MGQLASHHLHSSSVHHSTLHSFTDPASNLFRWRGNYTLSQYLVAGSNYFCLFFCQSWGAYLHLRIPASVQQQSYVHSGCRIHFVASILLASCNLDGRKNHSRAVRLSLRNWRGLCARCAWALLSLEGILDSSMMTCVELRFNRSLYGRIFNVGDVKIWSLMPTEVELLLAGVNNPSHYRDIIIERKSNIPSDVR